MCGIHAVINKANFARTSYEGFMKDGFVAGSLRGMDSSGIMQIDKTGKPFMYKEAVMGPRFIDGKNAIPFLRDAANCPLTIGHVRAATAGKVTHDNAHPFCVNRADGTRLLGVHNGTLSNWSYKAGASKFDVDSEWALNAIATEGADAFEKFLGAWAFIWWDERHKDKVFVARNDQRTLHFLRTKDKQSMLIASEAGMLAWLAERNRIETEDTVYAFDPGKLYTIDFSGGEVSWSKSHYPAYKAVVYTPSNNSSSSNDNRRHWNPNAARWEDRRGNAYGVCGVGNEDYAEYGESGVMGTLGSGPIDKSKNKNQKTHEEVGKEALEVIDQAKKILAANRDRRFRKSTDKSEGAGEAAEGSAAVVEEKEELPNNEYNCKPDWYSDATATVNERQAAKEAGVYGELQWFVGIHYEPETSEIFGEIEDFISGQGKVRYDALVRLATSSNARSWCAPTGKGCWVAVIGKGTDNKYKGTYYTVAPLNDKGLTALKQRAA